jgi:predicted metalloprotease
MFKRDTRLDPSQVRDRRGMGAAAGIGGGGAILLVLLSLLLGFDPSAIVDTSPGVQAPQGGAELAQECQTGEDANERQDCRIVGFVNSIQAYWDGEFSRRGRRYEYATTELFTGVTRSACGTATSQVGPFYCPPAQEVFLDLSFFNDLLTRLGAQGGPFAEAYVLAHEYGHHVQNLIGVLDRAQGDRQGADSGAVRVELQADCLAGVWAANAVSTGYLLALTDEQIGQGLDAAAAVGDDRIQQRTRGQVDPESWTHGSSAQRQRWFLTGYRQGNLDACDTFSGPI